MEERPRETVALIRDFLDAPPAAAEPRPLSEQAGNAMGKRLAPAEYEFPPTGNPGTGSSGVSEIRTVVLKGDPNKVGVYTIMLQVPPHTQIAAHSHRDDRVATVISGNWRIGYGDKFDQSKLKTLPPGSFYTEPPAKNHFAETGDEPVIVQITGYGPSSTDYVNPGSDPRKE